jgi:16S rRNA (cytidine1402-2'-O)-methyltransferase
MTISKNITQLLSDAKKPASGLYIVSTPIGNLKDITLRALEILSFADVVFCEDTRVSKKLMDAYGIKQSLKVYNDHSGDRDRRALISLLSKGKIVVLISDAGTPLISDPGYKLVKEVRDEGFDLFSIPGPSAAIAAISASGLPSDTFTFLGFLPTKVGDKKKLLNKHSSSGATVVLYESAKRIKATLATIEEVYGKNTEVVVAREITKKFEEFIKGSVAEVAKKLATKILKGEIVLLIAPREIVVASDEDIEQELQKRLKKESVKDAVAAVADMYALPKKKIYNLALAIKDGGKK